MKIEILNLKLRQKNQILALGILIFKYSNKIKYFAYVLVDKQKQNILTIVGHTCTCKAITVTSSFVSLSSAECSFCIYNMFIINVKYNRVRVAK
ncbi:hypothetical protein PUN28_020626 [Cardiocondyla obscurior]|uniref:Uncharacterized protein n=1 Tax=Cardiocondyla obscurior TaxID=286306 RepID=A0AAW2E8U0_9HYME